MLQVEAALSVDPENDQLVKLKADLQVLLALTFVEFFNTCVFVNGIREFS